MNEILVTDLHLTDRPIDEYRWGLFEFLRVKIANELSGLKTLFILGDLTVNKNYHSAKLVNRMVENIVVLYRSTGLNEIVILRGNHDGLGDEAYFDFLKHFSFIKVITKAQLVKYPFQKIALLPHARDSREWATVEFSEAKKIYMHQTVKGAVTESGLAMEGGDDFQFLQHLNVPIYSGDIHVPQKIGNVEYVGAPYPIHFGDDFKGRVLVLRHKQRIEWHYPTIQKVKRKIVYKAGKLGDFMAGLRKNDQAKFEVELGREDYSEFQKIKDAINQQCEKAGVLVCGVELKQKAALKLKGTPDAAPQVMTPGEALGAYCERTGAPQEVTKTGKKLLAQAGYSGSGSTQQAGELPTQPPKLRLKLKASNGL